MFICTDKLCVSGGKACEDAIGSGRRYVMAVDGASGLTGARVTDHPSDAKWFAEGVQAGAGAAFEAGDERHVSQILWDVIDGLEKEYANMAAVKDIPLPPDSPSAGVALFRLIGDEVEFYGLGDCVGGAVMKDGSVFTSCDDMLPMLDNTVISRMAQIHRDTGVTVLEAREQCADMLLENRMKRNTPGGYWILDLTKEALTHARTWKVAAGDVDRLFVCSDGFAQLADTFNIYPDHAELCKSAVQGRLQDMADVLFAAQEADRDCNAHPRFKFRDDTCAVCAIVEE